MMEKKNAFVRDFTECNFEETLEYQPYFSYNWTDTGTYSVHSSIIDTIQAWAALCTDPNNGIHFFKNPTAMFAALDLIHKLITETEKDYLEFQEHKRGEYREYIVPKITEKKHVRKCSDTRTEGEK